MIKKESVLTLDDDNEYVVVDTFDKNGITYIYLVDINNNANIIYGKIINDVIKKVIDPDELEMVIKEVYNHTHSN